MVSLKNIDIIFIGIHITWNNNTSIINMTVERLLKDIGDLKLPFYIYIDTFVFCWYVVLTFLRY